MKSENNSTQLILDSVRSQMDVMTTKYDKMFHERNAFEQEISTVIVVEWMIFLYTTKLW